MDVFDLLCYATSVPKGVILALYTWSTKCNKNSKTWWKHKKTPNPALIKDG